MSKEVECFDIVALMQAIEDVATKPEAALSALRVMVDAGMFEGFYGFLASKWRRKLFPDDATWEQLGPERREAILRSTISGLADSIAMMQEEAEAKLEAARSEEYELSRADRVEI